ncbi:LacI family DNA-binding transcriptional regulator [Streptomyces sp. NPDC012888]|uniref:LacI family DNA-binding transcriptional regulator n=1 Tax=Streptomyces sp. NPDC012888 TaxID=3364855 RepID=UPI0036C7A1FE
MSGRIRGGGRPTLEEVARRAGVGRGTVSRVVNGSAKVSEHTRAAVEAAVAELGYVPDRAARALAGNRADAVALVLPGPEGDDPGFAELVRGVGAVLAEADMQLLLTPAGGDRRRLADRLAAYRVDGVLLPSVPPGDPLPALLAERGTPLVVGGPRPAGGAAAGVDADHAGGARAAVRHLLARGRTAIAAVAGPLDVPAARSRLEGYRQALAGAGRIPDEGLVAGGEFTEEGGRRAVAELLDRRPGLDAVFAASDLMAAGARRELLARGRRIPGDVALVGFGDSAFARHLDPPLTTVRPPLRALGGEMARALLDRIAGEREPVDVRLPAELVVRGSS